MTEHHIIPCQLGEGGAIYASSERIMEEDSVPSYHFDFEADHQVVELRKWPFTIPVSGACTLTYRCNMTDKQFGSDLTEHPVITPAFGLEKFNYYMPDPIDAPVASVGSDEWGPYQVPFGTYTFKYCYKTPDGLSLISPASNAVVINAENQWVDLTFADVDAQYKVAGVRRQIFVSKDGGDYEPEWYTSSIYSISYEYSWPSLGTAYISSTNTTGDEPWGYAEFFAPESYAVVINTDESLSDVLGWGTLDVGRYRLTVTYAAWTQPYTYFTWEGVLATDVDEFTVPSGVSTKALTYSYSYGVKYGWFLATEWSWNALPLWDKIQNATELTAAQAAWDDAVGDTELEEVDWEIIYQTGDVFQSADKTRGFFISDPRFGRPCIETGAGSWYSLGIRTAYRPSAVGQYGYELHAPYSYAEMQPVADLLHEKKEHSGTGIPWIREMGYGTWDGTVAEFVHYGWFQAWGDWAPAQNWGRIMFFYNGLDFVHTPANYPTTPYEPADDQWSLP